MKYDCVITITPCKLKMVDMEIVHIISGKIETKKRHEINRAVEHLVQYQNSNTAKVSIWCIDYNSDPIFFRKKTKFLNFSKSRQLLKLNKNLKSEIKLKNIDTVFHIHGAFILEYYLITKLLIETGRNYVYTPHCILNGKQFNITNLKNYFQLKIIERKIIENAVNIQCTEISESQLISQHFPRVTPALISLPPNRIESKSQFKPLRKREKLIFGFSGQISIEENGLDLLIKGFSRYRSKLKGDALLWIIGSGDDTNVLKKYAQSTAESKYIKFHSPTNEDEKTNYIANIDVIFSTARENSNSSQILEAAKLGIPSVTNKESAICKNISHYNAGFVLAKNRITDIATAMKKMEEKFVINSIRNEGENALKMMQKEYSWDQVAANIRSLYP
jgi:glycosyltransferase involved in cell wall biosynthesis